MRRILAALLLLAGAPLPGATRPIVAHFTTCAQLSPSLYPADTTTWFDASKNPQIVFYAHMLFPLKPGQDEPGAGQLQDPWHPPMVWNPPTPLNFEFSDEHFAEAEWLDPEGAVIAHYGLTMPARVPADFLRLQGRQYIPHTFAMTIGTKDLRFEAGQRALPAKTGQYHVRFYVNRAIEGIAFFRMMNQGGAPSGAEFEAAPRAMTVTPGDSGLNALRDIFKALTKTGK